METHIHVSTIYHCTLERAFRTPILCDVTKVHTGMGIMPKIVGTSEDQGWGQPGSTKKAWAAKSWTQKGGFVSMDKVLERVENKYWRIEVYDFQAWMLGFYKFGAKWTTTELAPGKIQIDYDYTLYGNGMLLYPLQWLFGKLFWKKYMKQVLENIRQMTHHEEPYQYN